MFVILNEVKNLDLHTIRSFADAQDGKLRSCRAECAVFAHSAEGSNAQVLLCRSEPATSPRKTNISWRSHSDLRGVCLSFWTKWRILICIP